MRKTEISLGEYYHIYNRGNNKQIVFQNRSDFARFLFLLLCLQSPITFQNMSRYTRPFVQSLALNIGADIIRQIHEERFVDIVCFALMSNHFHLLLGEKTEGGISKFMHRVLTAYTKYINTKYKRSGHVFQGTFQAVHAEDNEQLLHLTAYIHRNQNELSRWHNQTEEYPWSSYQDYSIINRWGELLQQDIILNQFEGAQEYDDFVRNSSTKADTVLNDDHLDLFKA